ncbi:MAG: hypothetical protein IJT49_02885 [Clostridia bacterium]|nr:hypothetical protein [Clostridia bacterium]
MDDKLNEALKGVLDSLTDEQKKKAKECKTKEEFIRFADEEGVELPAEALDKISGGYHRQVKDAILRCKRCDAEKYSSELEYGYCRDCLKEMKDNGIIPLL